ncbi:MAG: cysteine desulfurase [Candidatus Dormibacteraeota bacterium]|nr:cysteine desulfurase [Candidatus Dormibacteraeota bacterium]
MTDTKLETYDVSRIRHDFPIFETGVAYLDSANTAQRPRAVLDAMEEYFTEYNSNILRAAYRMSERATAGFEGARKRAQEYINAASPREVVFTSGTTGGLNLVAYSWGRRNIQAGDVIVTTVMEHHSNLVPWQQLAEERGARLSFVDIDEHGRLRQDQYRALLEESPKLVAFNQISNTLGTINPVKEMTDLAHAAGAVVVVDGAQGAPHLGIDVQDVGCDFYAFSSHKMCGPTGIGVLYGRRSLLEAMPPFFTGGEMIDTVTLQKTTFAPLPHKFEAGTQPIAEAIGMGAAIDYLQEVGREAMRAHEAALTDYAIEALGEVPGLRVFGPPAGAADRAGVISFEIAGIHPHDVATILDRHDVAVRSGHNCTMPLMDRLDVPATVRASLYLYNTQEDVDRLVAGLHDAGKIFGL